MMRTLILVCIVVIGVGVGLGFYRGWFHVSSGDDTNKSTYILSVDKDKMDADKDKAVQSVTPASSDDSD